MLFCTANWRIGVGCPDKVSVVILVVMPLYPLRIGIKKKEIAMGICPWLLFLFLKSSFQETSFSHTKSLVLAQEKRMTKWACPIESKIVYEVIDPKCVTLKSNF